MKLAALFLFVFLSVPAHSATVACLPGEIPAFPERVMDKLYDTAVNTGVSRASKILQEALNQLIKPPKLAVDGKIGPSTRRAICGLDENAVLSKYAERQAAFYRAIVARKPSQAKFLKGWLRRAAWIPPEKKK
jgi:lysozyme family protein